MKAILQKIKRVQPLIKAKKSELNVQSVILTNLKEEKRTAIAALKENQRKYMYGIDQINLERSQGNLGKAIVLEPAVDSIKYKWHETLKQVSEIENKEKSQIRLVIALQTKLKSFEKLEEHYLQLKADYMSKEEQKESDELSSQKRS